MVGKVHSKYSALAGRIVENIRCGIYGVGSKLPAERNLSLQYQVSRNTVREALSDLFEYGILERCGRGAFVTERALSLIEGRDVPGSVRVLSLLPFYLYESPMYRTIFEIVRDGLADRATSEVWFSEHLPGQAPELATGNDIVLVFGDCGDESIQQLRRKCRAVVMVNSRSNLFFSVVPDNYAAGRAVAAYLYEYGHRKIGAALCRPDYPNEFGDRYRGVRDFLSERGVKLLAEPVSENQSEFAIMRDFLDAYRRQEVTAMICFKDISALMLYELARQKKLELPRDMSVVSFDDRCFTASVRPALSTVRYPAEEVGRAVLEMLLKLLDGAEPAPQVKIEPALFRRESVARIGGGGPE